MSPLFVWRDRTKANLICVLKISLRSLSPGACILLEVEHCCFEGRSGYDLVEKGSEILRVLLTSAKYNVFNAL